MATSSYVSSSASATSAKASGSIVVGAGGLSLTVSSSTTLQPIPVLSATATATTSGLPIHSDSSSSSTYPGFTHQPPSAPLPLSTIVLPLSLPPEGVFSSYDELFDSIQAHAKLAGYAFVIGKSDTRNGRKIRILSCKRGGKHDTRHTPHEDLRIRERHTLKTDCCFSLKARQRPDGSWTLQHRPESKYSTHNHSPAESPSAFPEHRRLSTDQKNLVTSNYAASIATRYTASLLRTQDPTLQLSKRDLYNIAAKVSREQRNGKTPPEALIGRLEAEKAANKLYFEYELDSQGHISKVFIADIRSVKYLNDNPDIILLDCTYKSNKFGMPLLDIIGIDGLNQGFTVGLCFLDQETEQDYDFAIKHLRLLFQEGNWPSIIATDCELALMKAISKAFPPIRTKTILCYWHISKNVLSNCKARFETEERWEEFFQGFRNIVYAKTEEEYEDVLEEWKGEFYWNDSISSQVVSSSTPREIQQFAESTLEREAVAYCLKQWFGEHKTKIVHAWTDQYFHGGTTTTSRLEGAHAVLKKWIGSSSKDLTRVWEATKLALDDQISEITNKRTQETSSTPLGLSSTFFYGVIGKITHFGLYKLKAQYKLATQEQRYQVNSLNLSSICTGTYYSSMGIPCWHMIKSKIEANQVIQPLDFHPHCHYQRPPAGSAPVVFLPPILDPIIKLRRRVEESDRRAHMRANNRLQVAATGRILSQFEQHSVPQNHCSACVQRGHNRITCRGCKSTGHTRRTCPNRPFEMGSL